MVGTCLEGDVKEKFGVYPSWSSQGMLHVTQVTSGGGFQSFFFLAGIRNLKCSAIRVPRKKLKEPGLSPFLPPPNSSYGSGILGSYFLYAKFFFLQFLLYVLEHGFGPST